MDFGVSLPTPSDAWRYAKRAEDAGYRTCWFYDTQLLSADVFVAMGAAAMKTDRIRLATGVLIPSNRIAPSAANAYATLNAMAPGRIDAGIGTGYTGRRTMGLGPYKLAEMDEYIRTMQAMWRGETPEIRIEGKTRKVRFLNPDLGLINIDDPIPIHISAFGPKARKLTADLGAHWINVDFSEDLARTTAQEMDRLYREAGNDPATKRKTIFLWGSVLKEGEAWDSPRMKAETGPFAVMMLHNAMEAQDHGSLVDGDQTLTGEADTPIARLAREYRPIYESYQPADARYLTLHRGHLMFVRPEEERFATAELIRTATISGTVPELRDRMRQLKDAGYDEVVVQVTPNHIDMVDDWARVFEAV
jgi:5,10-methylenetetrahydromethanopterin reductase